VAALICFGIAAVSFGGLILSSDSVGRAIFGCAWGALGLVWFIRYLTGRQKSSDSGEVDSESSDQA